MADDKTDPPEKPQEGHLETTQTQTEFDDVGKGEGYVSYGLVKSRYDELSIPQTLWVFRRAVLVTLAVYTGYVCEGFEVSLTLIFLARIGNGDETCSPWTYTK